MAQNASVSLKNVQVMPPIAIARTLRYGPRIIPNKGANTTAALVHLSFAPTMGNRSQEDKFTYKAAKHAVKDISLVDKEKFMLNPFALPL